MIIPLGSRRSTFRLSSGILHLPELAHIQKRIRIPIRQWLRPPGKSFVTGQQRSGDYLNVSVLAPNIEEIPDGKEKS